MNHLRTLLDYLRFFLIAPFVAVAQCLWRWATGIERHRGFTEILLITLGVVYISTGVILALAWVAHTIALHWES